MASDDFDFYNLTGKTALVTGASSGLGWAFALRLAKQGANVVVAARRVDRLASLVEEIEGLPTDRRIAPGRAKMLEMDMSRNEAHIAAAVDGAWAAFGSIHVLVNNAGVVEQRGNPLAVTEDDWARTLDVNVKGLALVLKSVAKRMIEGGVRGSIINMSSILGTERGVFGDCCMYSASKAAVTQFTKAIAIELGKHSIRVNALGPGVFESEMTASLMESMKKNAPKIVPLGRPGNPDPELTGPLLFFASDASSYVTGTTLIVDGGHTLALRPVMD